MLGNASHLYQVPVSLEEYLFQSSLRSSRMTSFIRRISSPRLRAHMPMPTSSLMPRARTSLTMNKSATQTHDQKGGVKLVLVQQFFHSSATKQELPTHHPFCCSRASPFTKLVDGKVVSVHTKKVLWSRRYSTGTISTGVTMHRDNKSKNIPAIHIGRQNISL